MGKKGALVDNIGNRLGQKVITERETSVSGGD